VREEHTSVSLHPCTKEGNTPCGEEAPRTSALG
jgi:hypothetical protein